MPRTARMGPKRLAMPRTSRTGPSYLVEARTDPGWHALPRSVPAEARNACSGGHRSWGCAAGRRCSVVGDGLGDQSRRLGGGVRGRGGGGAEAHQDRAGGVVHLDDLAAEPERPHEVLRSVGHHLALGGALVLARSEGRRGGKAWVSTCRSRWSPYQ